MKSVPTVIGLLLLLIGGQECWSWLGVVGGSELQVSPADMDALILAMQDGFRHILPDGWDHVAFLLGLFFLSRSFPVLLWQVTLFTLAHSLTLGLVVVTGLSMPTQAVEVAVGLSIVAIALECFYPERFKKWRPALIIIFGCIHGLAFAHNLVLASITQNNPLAALFGFNLGVELGQVTVIGIAYLSFCRWWQRDWYQHRIALPACAMIAISGLVWAVQRV